MVSDNLPNPNHSANGSRETSDFGVSRGWDTTDATGEPSLVPSWLLFVKKSNLAQERCHHLVDWRRQVPVLRRLTVHVGRFHEGLC